MPFKYKLLPEKHFGCPAHMFPSESDNVNFLRYEKLCHSLTQ